MSMPLGACTGKTSPKVWLWTLSVNRTYTDNGTKRKKSELPKSGRRFLQPRAFLGVGSVPASSYQSRVPGRAEGRFADPPTAARPQPQPRAVLPPTSARTNPPTSRERAGPGGREGGRWEGVPQLLK